MFLGLKDLKNDIFNFGYLYWNLILDGMSFYINMFKKAYSQKKKNYKKILDFENNFLYFPHF